MDQPWLYANLTTAISVSQPVKLLCMGSRENHGSDAARPARPRTAQKTIPLLLFIVRCLVTAAVGLHAAVLTSCTVCGVLLLCDVV